VFALSGTMARMTATLDEHLDEPLLKPRQAAPLLNVSLRTLYTLIERGELPVFRVGGQYRLSRSTLAAWLDGQATKSSP
jgi:excisionase family DNA binding protein